MFAEITHSVLVFLITITVVVVCLKQNQTSLLNRLTNITQEPPVWLQIIFSIIFKAVF